MRDYDFSILEFDSFISEFAQVQSDYDVEKDLHVYKINLPNNYLLEVIPGVDYVCEGSGEKPMLVYKKFTPTGYEVLEVLEILPDQVDSEDVNSWRDAYKQAITYGVYNWRDFCHQ